MRISSLLLLVMTAVWSCPAIAAPPATDADAVRSVVNDFSRVWETKDMALLARIMAHDHDLVVIGTDPDEYFVGWDALREAVAKMFSSLQNVRLTVTHQVIQVRPGARVAWFSQRVAWDFVFDGKPVHQDCRFSGVLEKRHGKWVFVHVHNSVPAS